MACTLYDDQNKPEFQHCSGNISNTDHAIITNREMIKFAQLSQKNVQLMGRNVYHEHSKLNQNAQNPKNLLKLNIFEIYQLFSYHTLNQKKIAQKLLTHMQQISECQKYHSNCYTIGFCCTSSQSSFVLINVMIVFVTGKKVCKLKECSDDKSIPHLKCQEVAVYEATCITDGTYLIHIY